MKKTLATTAMILATAGTAAFAQGMEGQRIGYNDKGDAAVSYSSRSEAVDAINVETFTKGFLRAEDLSDVTLTVVKAKQDLTAIERSPR